MGVCVHGRLGLCTSRRVKRGCCAAICIAQYKFSLGCSERFSGLGLRIIGMVAHAVTRQRDR